MTVTQLALTWMFTGPVTRNGWYAATVLKTRAESHTVDGAKTLCREILCFYDIDGDIQWHSLHDRDVRVSTTPLPVDQSGIADPCPTGTRVDVWWTV